MSDFDAFRAGNITEMEKRAEFRARFSMLEKDEKGNITREALEAFAFQDNAPLSFSAPELMQIFTAFRAQKSFDNMISLVDLCGNAAFSSSEIVQEFYIVACNQMNRFDDCIRHGESLLESGHANGEIYGALGKAYLKKHDVAKAAGKTEEAQLFLEKSKNAYEQGFLHSFEYYPGINTAYRMLDLGEFDQAVSVARMVHASCQRDGGRESMDYWCAATMMEALCIMEIGRAHV